MAGRTQVQILMILQPTMARSERQNNWFISLGEKDVFPFFLLHEKQLKKTHTHTHLLPFICVGETTF